MSAPAKYNRVIVPAWSDTHGGHRGALLNPNSVIELIDEEGGIYEYHPKPTERQKYLWNLNTYTVEAVKRLAGNSKIFVMHGGDHVEGNKHPSELVMPEIYAQEQIAFWNMLPAMELPNVDYVRLLKGTGAHEFGFASAVRGLGASLKRAYPQIDTEVVQHGLATIAGVEFDYAHHGPYPGSRKWLEGNVARYYLRDRMMADIEVRGRPADVYMRGHYHVPIIEYLRVGGFWSVLVILPSMKMGGEYAWQATKSNYLITNGIYTFEVDNGKLQDIHEFVMTKDLRTKEKFYV